LVRKFNEENNEEAGEHWTPRDAVRLMANLVFLPVAGSIQSGAYKIYDGACGTGGMLTVAEETLQNLVSRHGIHASTYLYGQEINPETYAICKADMLLKGEGDRAATSSAAPSTLPYRTTPSRRRSSPSCSPIRLTERVGRKTSKPWAAKEGMRDPRFKIAHGDDAEYSLITRSSDGQMLFLANMAGKNIMATSAPTARTSQHQAPYGPRTWRPATGPVPAGGAVMAIQRSGRRSSQVRDNSTFDITSIVSRSRSGW